MILCLSEREVSPWQRTVKESQGFEEERQMPPSDCKDIGGREPCECLCVHLEHLGMLREGLESRSPLGERARRCNSGIWSQLDNTFTISIKLSHPQINVTKKAKGQYYGKLKMLLKFVEQVKWYTIFSIEIYKFIFTILILSKLETQSES